MTYIQAKSYLFWLALFLIASSAIIFHFSIVSSLIFTLGGNVPLFVTFTLIFFVGIGTGIFIHKNRPKYDADSLLFTQMGMSAIGLIALPGLFLLFGLCRQIGLSDLILKCVLWGTGLLIDFLIGFLMGRPIFIAPEVVRQMKWPSRKMEFVLSLQFIGCFVGAILFPLVLFPKYGFFRTVAAAELLATSMCLVTYLSLNLQNRKILGALLGLSAAALALYGLTPQLEGFLLGLTEKLTP